MAQDVKNSSADTASNPEVEGSKPSGRATSLPEKSGAFPRTHPAWLRYVRVTVNGKRGYLHRFVMEEFLGRPLGRKEVVHHKDHNPLNNNLSNLELTNPTDHSRHHNARPAIMKICPECGKRFNVRGGFLAQRFCSQACSWNAKTCGVQVARKICAHCGDEFLPRAGSWPQWHRARFCSIPCAATYRWRNRQGIGSAKIDKERADAIRALRASGVPVKEVGRRFGIHGTTVSHITSGRIWK